MPGSQLTDSQIRDVVGWFAGLDLGSWGREDALRVLGERGWSRVDDEESSPFGGAELAAGEGYASLNADEAPALTAVFADGLELDRAVAVFDTARRIAEDTLGPPALRGGPGPWLRWRRPGTTPRLVLRMAAYDQRLAYSVRFELLVTERFENAEARAAEYRGEQPYTWCRITHSAATDGMYFAGDHVAETWADFEHCLGQTARDLVNGATILREGPLTLAVEQRGGAEGNPPPPACYISLAEATLRISCAVLPDPNAVRALTELGWTPPDQEWIDVLTGIVDVDDWQTLTGNSNFVRNFPVALPFSRDLAAEVARLVVGAFRLFCGSPAELTYWVGTDGENSHIRLPELGI